MGKTIETLALLVANIGYSDKRDPGAGGTLIICPNSVLGHWQEEIQKHVLKDYLKVTEYYSNKRERDEGKLAEYDIVLTTYNVLATEFAYQDRG